MQKNNETTVAQTFDVYRQAFQETQQNCVNRGLTPLDATQGALERVEAFFGVLADNPCALRSHKTLLQEGMVGAGFRPKTINKLLRLNHTSPAFQSFVRNLSMPKQ